MFSSASTRLLTCKNTAGGSPLSGAIMYIRSAGPVRMRSRSVRLEGAVNRPRRPAAPRLLPGGLPLLPGHTGDAGRLGQPGRSVLTVSGRLRLRWFGRWRRAERRRLRSASRLGEGAARHGQAQPDDREHLAPDHMLLLNRVRRSAPPPRPTPAGAGIVPFEQGFPEIGTAGSPGSSVPLAVDHQQQDRYGGARSVTGGGSTARLAAAVGGNRPRPDEPPAGWLVERVRAVAFSPGGLILASGGGDKTVHLWDLRDPAHPEPMGQPRSPATPRTSRLSHSHPTARLW
jgi:hypothetical protein